jgi:hypothetical protein
MKGRRDKTQQDLTSFFSRTNSEGKSVAAAAPAPEGRTKKTPSKQAKQGNRRARDEQEEEGVEEGVGAAKKPEARRSRAKKDDEENVKENNAKAVDEEETPASRQQPRRRAKGQESEEEEEDNERSLFVWHWMRELGVHPQMSALDCSLYKDNYCVDVDPRIGCPYFLRHAHGMLTFGGTNGSLGVADAATGRVIAAASSVYQRWTSEGWKEKTRKLHNTKTKTQKVFVCRLIVLLLLLMTGPFVCGASTKDWKNWPLLMHKAECIQTT